jgi:hypothetical protein
MVRTMVPRLDCYSDKLMAGLKGRSWAEHWESSVQKMVRSWELKKAGMKAMMLENSAVSSAGRWVEPTGQCSVVKRVKMKEHKKVGMKERKWVDCLVAR